MPLKIDVTCPQGHESTAGIDGLPNISRLNWRHDFSLPEKCPVCGETPLKSPSGFYEIDNNGEMIRTGEFREQLIWGGMWWRA